MSRRNARVRMARGGTKGERRECVPFYPGWPGVLPLVLSSPGLTPLSELNDLMRGRCSWVAPPPLPQRRLWGPALPSLLQRASFCLFCRLSSNSTGFCALVFISFFCRLLSLYLDLFVRCGRCDRSWMSSEGSTRRRRQQRRRWQRLLSDVPNVTCSPFECCASSLHVLEEGVEEDPRGLCLTAVVCCFF